MSLSDLRRRAMRALNWGPLDVGQVPLPALRDLVRGVDHELAQEITAALEKGTHIIERAWSFGRGDVVRHAKTQTLYGVVAHAVVEASLAPAYVYTECFKYGNFMGPCYSGRTDAPTWVRPAAEFEDGRFELVVAGAFS